MLLRKAKTEEFGAVRDFYWDLIDLSVTGKKNSVGWIKGVYPSDDFLRDSIEAGELYVIDGEGRFKASVILNHSWNEGYEGLPWSLDCPREEVLVPHALAVWPELQGQGLGAILVQDIIDMARASGVRTIRLDILGGNAAAERLYTKMGFSYVQAKQMYYEDTGWTEFIMYELLIK